MTIFPKALWPVAALLLCAGYLPAANTVLAYGPAVFTVPSGPPAAETVSFALPKRVYNPFTLLVSHQEVTGVNVQLNGAPVFGSQAFGSRPLQAVVELQAENTLQVELTGAVGGSVTVMIMGNAYEHQAEYESLPLAPAVTVTGAATTSIDWRQKGAVTPVKNQGQCGSGWAFSATGALEGLWALAGHPLVSLSEQQLIECDHSETNHGCDGGYPWEAFDYVVLHKGIGSEPSYPYTARDGLCKVATSVAGIQGLKRLPASEDSIAAYLLQQPVSVVVDADNAEFQSYSGGVLNGLHCGKTPNQPVLVVGLTPDYWIVKNSWGTAWGMGGYIYIARGKDACGIADWASIPVGAQ